MTSSDYWRLPVKGSAKKLCRVVEWGGANRGQPSWCSAYSWRAFRCENLDGTSADTGPGHDLGVDCSGIRVDQCRFQSQKKFIDWLQSIFLIFRIAIFSFFPSLARTVLIIIPPDSQPGRWQPRLPLYKWKFSKSLKSIWIFLIYWKFRRIKYSQKFFSFLRFNWLTHQEMFWKVIINLWNTHNRYICCFFIFLLILLFAILKKFCGLRNKSVTIFELSLYHFAGIWIQPYSIFWLCGIKVLLSRTHTIVKKITVLQKGNSAVIKLVWRQNLVVVFFVAYEIKGLKSIQWQDCWKCWVRTTFPLCKEIFVKTCRMLTVAQICFRLS